MPAVDDILIDPATCDIQIVGGDLLVGASDQQHVEHIIRADRGHWRQYPLVGVGIEKFFKGPFDTETLKELIELQLEGDNYNVKQIIVTKSGSVSIDAERIV